MTYKALAEMYESSSLRARITAAAAEEGINNPDTRLEQLMWKIVARTEWKDAWHGATMNYNESFNPDTGARPDVITDQMIQDVVQAIKSQLTT